MSAQTSARTERIAQDLGERLAALTLLVEEVSVAPAGKRRIVRVLVDRSLTDDGPPTTEPTPPVDLDLVAEATRLISATLDETDAMGQQPYVLEVSSPGTDRPLTSPRHFRRNVGRLVRIERDGDEPLEGRILAADGAAVTIEVTGEKGATSQVPVPYAECGRASVQVEFTKVDKGADNDASDDGQGAER